MTLVTRLGFVCLVGCIAPLLGGCSNAEARVTINAWLPAPLASDMLKVRIDDGRTVWNLTGADFQLAGAAQYNGPMLQTASQGTLTVSYTLVPPAPGIAVSTGSIELPLRNDWGYGVDIRPDTADPRRFCFGCIGSKAFLLAPEFRSSQADSVYLLWGGNSISHPVIY